MCFFYHSGFLSNFALALKNIICPEIFHCIEYTFYIQEFWATCACPEKQSCPENFNCIEIFLSFRIFEQLALALKNLVCPEFPVLNVCFYHSGFLSILRLPWKTELLWNFSLYWIYIFYYSGFLSNLRFPWKTELPWNFSLYWNIFIIQDFWATCACPEKQSVTWNFSRRGASAPPAPLSKLRRLKSCTRSTMGQNRLQNLVIPYVEDALARKISYDKIISDFADKMSRRSSTYATGC